MITFKEYITEAKYHLSKDVWINVDGGIPVEVLEWNEDDGTVKFQDIETGEVHTIAIFEFEHDFRKKE